MLKFWKILLLFLTMNAVNCEDKNNNLLKGIINLFMNMNVHTVWATTCWNTSIKIDLNISRKKKRNINYYP